MAQRRRVVSGTVWHGDPEAAGCLSAVGPGSPGEPGLTRMPELDRRPGGKPYFPHEEGLEFNLSHSGHLALCALDNAPVGARHPDGQRVAARTARPGLWSGRVGLAGRAVGLVEVLFPAMVTEREPGQRERAGIEGDHPVHPGPDDGEKGKPGRWMASGSGLSGGAAG